MKDYKKLVNCAAKTFSSYISNSLKCREVLVILLRDFTMMEMASFMKECDLKLEEVRISKEGYIIINMI
jgi:hypothetical protein